MFYPAIGYNLIGCILAVIAELAVENYAVIERLRVRFHRGLNLLTGETGSGKSIVVDALGLLFGGRASAEMVRAGAERARVSGIFEVRHSAALGRLLESRASKSRTTNCWSSARSWPTENRAPSWAAVPLPARCCGSWRRIWAISTASTISSSFFQSEAQREMLDAFAGADESPSRSPYTSAGARATAELEELDRTAQEKLRLADLWSFQRKEIEAVAPAARRRRRA